MLEQNRWLIALILLLGCDPDPNGGTTSEGSTSAGSSTSNGSTSAGSTSGGTENSTDGESSTSASEGGCEALDDDACEQADDCMLATLFRPDTDAACGVTANLGLFSDNCVERGEPITGRSTFFREIDGDLRYLVHGQGCFSLPATPVGWTECTGAPGEPEPCACLCADDDCPWQQDALTLDACGMEQPCGERVQHDLGEPLDDYMTCVMESLRDRTPGYYDLHVEGNWWGEFTRIYASGDDQVQMLFRLESDQCMHPLYGTWKSNELCTLEAPEFFDACLAGSVQQLDDCLFNEDWFSDCVPAEPICP